MPEHLPDLDGKIAVVTGGAKGIGAATARMLERAGARVTVLDIEPADAISVDVTNESAA
ncbi:MAG: SDR family NAD(P)-dependent oxidoreductase, partial [Vicinamibacterales bacterium]